MSISSTKSTPPPTEQPPINIPENIEVAKEDLTFWERTEAFITRLSTKNNFWHRVCSLIFLLHFVVAFR